MIQSTGRGGDRLAFVQEDGTVRIAKTTSAIERTAGILARYRLDHVPTDAEMDEAVALAIAEDATDEASR